MNEHLSRKRDPEPENSIRTRLLDAAFELIRTQGVQALTQPRVAKLAGVRQSHLTYYFPRRADLFFALFEASHARAHAHSGHGDVQETPNFFAFLNQLMFDRERARFFFTTILEVSEEPALRSVVAEHARSLARFVAPHFGRQADDPGVALFIDLLRGMALRALLEPEAPLPDIVKVAAALGLHAAAG
ncbi:MULTISPECIES: TetR/AcrR family transcriptional regulator [Burkholderia]|uniref:TetR family transcriptional regulator n=1 Tax=Burkholderia paludis TaxID=1506587 RepID=A0A6P2SC69_9BURK|nr:MULTISPECIES: TetR family transcriptional regulator [Burkholderia]CAB3773959.1 hypothetical protein LMG30113_07373 [Burkholderia paludis]VWC47782.1 TetR family transcriptional regulator [Burkholderia paludis]